MSHFSDDDHWQREKRDTILKPFYLKKSMEGRFIFADKGRLSDLLQREMAVDTLLQVSGNGVLAIEEKIVRWPKRGYKYTAYTLELMSCTKRGREKKGWMYYALCDVLFYCFVQADGVSLEAHAIPFPKLKAWFFEGDRYLKYTSTITEQINASECKVVPIDEVWRGVSGCKKFTLKQSLP
jgi:hypothetical protein